MIPWAFITVLCIIFFSGTAQHHRIHQPNKVIAVALGDTVTLQCYAHGDSIFWYKQIVGQQPQVISAFLKLSEPIFYNEFKNDRFWGKRLGSNSNLTISSITQSDEAVYYCGLRSLYIEFGSGTHLITKGRQNLASNISTSDHLNDYMECQQKCYENSTKQVKNGKQMALFSFFCDINFIIPISYVLIINLERLTAYISEEKLYPAVLGLACALGLCGVLVFALMGFIFRRSMCEQCLMQGSGQDNQVRGQSNAQDENVSYAALRFSRKKNKSGGKRGQCQQTMIVYTSDSLNVQ
ncbi:LOW QUALITY PROTEIN: novel immune-type receptor 14b [Ctenopharyngodon idella]|uniref:LOW QUALITY PROTEIN: novel immune-type receptor 14b n=1 Tax=Ctenopharyngodon idella TaxID=7959 RepID=UPI00222F4611|nr:LOW QUALITY PROTEIN: novel immune-type receptor 14b [Ctenopharyngodon idella]